MQAKRAKYPIDQDGKSKTASGVDQTRYPEQHEVSSHNGGAHGADGVSLDPQEVARRAYELWMQRGPAGGFRRDGLGGGRGTATPGVEARQPGASGVGFRAVMSVSEPR